MGPTLYACVCCLQQQLQLARVWWFQEPARDERRPLGAPRGAKVLGVVRVTGGSCGGDWLYAQRLWVELFTSTPLGSVISSCACVRGRSLPTPPRVPHVQPFFPTRRRTKSEHARPSTAGSSSTPLHLLGCTKFDRGTSECTPSKPAAVQCYVILEILLAGNSHFIPERRAIGHMYAAVVRKAKLWRESRVTPSGRCALQ